jgi:predicted aspartyl protease
MSTLRCAGLLALALASTAHGACKNLQLAEWPVTHPGNRPMIEGKINGQPVRILVDTGSAVSSMVESAARNLALPLEPWSGIELWGVGGQKRLQATTVKELQVGAYKATRMRLLVTSWPGSAPEEYVMLLGADFFSNMGTEFDVAHGVIRLLEPSGCKVDQLAYWSNTYALAQLRSWPNGSPETEVTINGKPVRAMLDTGAPVSTLDLAVAERIGLKPATVAAAKDNPERWLGLAETFSIGDEAIRNVHLVVQDLFGKDKEKRTGSRIGESAADFPGMLLGFDFLLSHRVFIVPKAHAMVFTYNGGPLFQGIEPETQAAAQAEPTNAKQP